MKIDDDISIHSNEEKKNKENKIIIPQKKDVSASNRQKLQRIRNKGTEKEKIYKQKANERQMLKRKRDKGTQKEEDRRYDDKVQKWTSRNYICDLRYLISKPPPRIKRHFACIYIGNNKFSDINGDCIEVIFTGYDNYRKDICLKLYQPVQIYGYFLYKRDTKVFDNNKFEKFWLQVYGDPISDKVLLTSEEDIQEDIVLFAKNILNKKNIHSNHLKDFIDLTDLIINSRWQGENKSPNHIIDPPSNTGHDYKIRTIQ